MNTNNTQSLAAIRQEYSLSSLDRKDLNDNPIQQFNSWFQHALKAEIEEVNAMTLATCDQQLKPSARIVLLKGIEKDCFIFYTNYESRKGIELQQNQQVALVFFWKELQRQIRIEGIATKIAEEQSTNYFHSRPIESQLGAWASAQSTILESREDLEAQFTFLEKKYAGMQIPKPHHWGGYAIQPTSVEFWQGRTNRLHDRFVYRLQENKSWKIERLYP
jgi:pyridoxamine 5'-phosphate oxidase